jgi:hypothetical protein
MCEFLQLDLTDLVRTAPRSSKLLERLTLQQEQEITGDLKLFIVAFCALHLLRAEEMLQYYKMTEAELIARMTRLEHIGFLELHPGNRYRLLFRGRSAGFPMDNRQLAKREMRDYHHSFDQANCCKSSTSGCRTRHASRC